MTAGPETADVTEVAIAEERDIVRVRQATRTAAVSAGLSLVDQTKVVTAASELARNALLYAGGGTATVAVVHDANRVGVRTIVEDRGPGIADISRAMTDGYTSGTGLGLGLSGARRLVDEFEIDSEVGRGTRVTIVKWGIR